MQESAWEAIIFVFIDQLAFLFGMPPFLNLRWQMIIFELPRKFWRIKTKHDFKNSFLFLDF